MRIIEEFTKALALVNEKDLSKKKDEIKKLYDQYVGPYELYHNAEMDDVMETFHRYPQQERAERMEMLAELYYTEADLHTGQTSQDMLMRAFALFDFIDRHDKTYSLERLAKMNDIKKRLEAAVNSGKTASDDGPADKGQ